MTGRDPVAPVRKRPRRVAKKLAKRYGMARCRGWSIERLSRATAPLAAIIMDNTLTELYRDVLLPELQRGAA